MSERGPTSIDLPRQLVLRPNRPAHEQPHEHQVPKRQQQQIRCMEGVPAVPFGDDLREITSREQPGRHHYDVGPAVGG